MAVDALAIRALCPSSLGLHQFCPASSGTHFPRDVSFLSSTSLTVTKVHRDQAVMSRSRMFSSRGSGLVFCNLDQHCGSFPSRCGFPGKTGPVLQLGESRAAFSAPRMTGRLPAKLVCRGAMAAVSDIGMLKPVLDKVMLLGTVVYFYVTGVSALPPFREVGHSSKTVPTRPVTPVRKRVNKKENGKQEQQRSTAHQTSIESVWLALDSKFSIAVLEQESGSEEVLSSNASLSLQAFSRTSREHLLHATLRQLWKEVEDIPDCEQNLSKSEWSDLSMAVLSRTVSPLCRIWITKDFTITNRGDDASRKGQLPDHLSSTAEFQITTTQSEVLAKIAQFLKDEQSMRAYFIRLGKTELYSDLMFFLRFGSTRAGGCCDYMSFSRLAGKALEDMVIVVAEVVATLFLDCCSSVTTLSPQSETWQTFLLPSILSTRSLERFRNEVALSGWVNENFTSVTAMFEDRFDLWSFQPGLQPVVAKQQEGRRTEKEKTVESRCRLLTQVQLPARRSDDLKLLSGWRYYYSLYLEFSDVVGPLLSLLLRRIGDGISFLLITLIGRSLGLIYQGIRQSLRISVK